MMIAWTITLAALRHVSESKPDAGAENKALIRRFYDEINRGHLTILDELVDTETLAHARYSASLGKTGTRPGSELPPVRRFFTSFRIAFPDARFAVEDLIAEGDRVVTRVTVTGTHLETPPDGPLAGIPATGKPITMRMVFIDRIAGGKIVERWGIGDNLRLMQQLGIYPPDGQIKRAR